MKSTRIAAVAALKMGVHNVPRMNKNVSAVNVISLIAIIGLVLGLLIVHTVAFPWFYKDNVAHEGEKVSFTGINLFGFQSQAMNPILEVGEGSVFFMGPLWPPLLGILLMAYCIFAIVTKRRIYSTVLVLLGLLGTFVAVIDLYSINYWFRINEFEGRLIHFNDGVALWLLLACSVLLIVLGVANSYLIPKKKTASNAESDISVP
jgi:hypothetical protein